MPPARRRRVVGLAALAAFIGTIFAANWSIAHVSTPEFPGGPHKIPVGPDLRAPSGVLWVGLALALRDVVPGALGRSAVVAAILVGAAPSDLLAPAFAAASAVAFLASETFSLLFLWIAFGSAALLPGQVLGKLWMTLAALLVLPVVRRRLVPWAAGRTA